MVLLGALVNGIAACLGGIVGYILKQKISQNMGNFLMLSISLCIVLLGVQGMTGATCILATSVEMVLGAAIGYLLNLDALIKKFGSAVQKRINARFAGSKTFGNVAVGFVNSTLIVCVGSMAIVGSLESGLLGNHSTLFSKSIIDFVINTLLATSMGIGVAFSGLAIIFYEGLLSICAHFLSSVLIDAVIQEMIVVGSLLLFALGLDMLGIKKIPVANLIPACFMPIIFVPILQILGFM